MMRLPLLFLWLAHIMVLTVHAGPAAAGALIGTWGWHHMRHEIVVTYKADGTYERKSSTMANGGAVQSEKGTWKLQGKNLIEAPSKKGSAPISSVIRFESKDRFVLDDFMTFERTR